MAYIGAEPIVSATRTVTEITATAGQTTFTANGGYTVGFIDVFVNGAQLQSTDFTATNGSTITLNSGATIGDDIRLVAYGTFSVANSYTAANIDSKIGAAQFAFKNRIINGDFRIDQRNAGASFTSNGLFYCLDRWQLQAVGATNSAQQVTGSTGNNKAVRITGNTGNTATLFGQKIESWNVLDLASQTVTVSFILSGYAAGSVSVRRLYPTATDNYSSTTEPTAGVTVNFTTTPTRYTATFTLGSNANKGMWLIFDFGAVGSGVTRTLEDVQLEVGSSATSFDYRPYGTELALCQRYFTSNFPVGVAPSDGGSGDNRVGVGSLLLGGALQSSEIAFKVSMRATPSITFYRPSFVATNGNWAIYPMAWGGGGFTPGVSGLSQDKVAIGGSGISGGTDYYTYILSGYLTANAEL